MNIHKSTGGRPRSVSDEAIFAVVADVIARAGPGGLTLAAIGRQAGLSAPALAQRFGTKRGLLIASAARGPEVVGRTFAAAGEAEASPLQALQAALEGLTQALRTRESLANNLAFLQLDLVDPELRAHAVDHSRELRRGIERLLAQARSSGELVGATDVAALASTVYLTYNGALITWAIDGTGPLHRWLRAAIEAVMAPYVAATGPA